MAEVASTTQSSADIGASLITATGAGAGQFDAVTLAKGLAAAETTAKMNRLEQKVEETTAKISALGELKSAFSDFSYATGELSKIENFHQRYATSSDPNGLGVTTEGKVDPGSYSVEVMQIAQAHSLASEAFVDASTTQVGTGTLSIKFGSFDYDAGGAPTAFSRNGDIGSLELTVDSSNNTLNGLKSAINAMDQGVQATVVNDGSGERLVLTSATTGEQMAMEISVVDGDGDNSDNSGLSRLAYSATANNLTETVQGEDASLKVNGLAITRSTNEVDGVIDGVTLNLYKSDPGLLKTITIEQDREVLSAGVNAFVDEYNKMMETIDDLTTLDESDPDDTAGLQRDSLVRSMVNQIRREVGEMMEGLNGPFNALGDVGVSVQRDGSLAVDQDKLDDALLNHFDEVGRLFADSSVSDDGMVAINSIDSKLIPPGSYAVDITQLATQGRNAGTVPANPSLEIDDDNDVMSLKVDGYYTGDITLTQKTYGSWDELASEMQNQINSSSTLQALGSSVKVSYQEGSGLTISSNKFGSSSAVEVLSVDTNMQQELGLDVGAGTAGVDVAGTIGGVAATGSGQRLTGADSMAGISLDVIGGSTGSRGSVHYSQGIAKRLDDLMTQFLDSSGAISTSESRLESTLEETNEDKEELEEHIVTLEDRYRRQYAMLDALMGQMEETSTMIEAMIDSLNPSDN